MPAKDIYHDTVRKALIKDGWTITHDPLRLRVGKKDMYVDLGAEELLAADKSGRKIAVEIKGFSGPSVMTDLERALGQFILYQDVLAQLETDRILYLAVSANAYEDAFDDALGKLLLSNQRIRLVVFDARQESIIQWIP